MRVNKVLGFAAVLALSVAIGAVAVVWAQAGGAHGRRHGFGFRRMALNHIGRQLNLAAQQKQQIKDIVRGRKEDIKALVDDGFTARKALRRAVAGGNNDAIAAAVTELSAVELKGAELRAQLRAKMLADVLQPDQRSKAGDLLARFEQRADQRRLRIDRFLDRF